MACINEQEASFLTHPVVDVAHAQMSFLPHIFQAVASPGQRHRLLCTGGVVKNVGSSPYALVVFGMATRVKATL